MEFLKALEEAQQLGVSKEDFVKIWELETKLKQQKEEVKALELKCACIQAQEMANLQEVGDQMKFLLENMDKSLKQQASQLKLSLLQQNKESLLQQTNQLKESLLQQNKESLLQQTNQLKVSLLQQNKESLLQQTNQLKESLLQQNKESLLQQTSQLKETLLQQNKESLLQQTNQLKLSLLQQTSQLTQTLLQQGQLKDSLLHQNKVQLQETSKQLENQVAMAAVNVKNELLDSLNQFSTKMKRDLLQVCMDLSKSGEPASASNDVQRSEDLQQEKPQIDQVPISSSRESNCSDSLVSYVDLFPSEDGAILYVKDLNNFSALKRVINSPDYALPDLPVIVYLTIWFNQTGNINVVLSLSGETGEALKTCMIFTVNGFIKNGNSGSFSVLFKGTSQPVRKLELDKETKVNTKVCLKTGSGSYDDATVYELESRGFVVNNSCTIKWFISSKEVKVNTAKKV